MAIISIKEQYDADPAHVVAQDDLLPLVNAAGTSAFGVTVTQLTKIERDRAVAAEGVIASAVSALDAAKEPADATILKDADIGVTVQAAGSYLTPSDISVSVQAYDATLLNDADIGVTVQGFDATLLNAADIGVSVQAYSASNALTSDITYETLAAAGDVGTGAGQLAIGNHTHPYLLLTGGTLTGNLVGKTITFGTETANTGTTQTVNWNTNQKQKTTITAATGMTFTAPAGPCNLTLKVVNGGTGVITWPAAVLWPGGTEPTWTTTGTDIASFYYDGTNYHGMAGIAFA